MTESLIKFVDEEVEKSFNELYEKYVPEEGKAETVGGEILRAVNNLTYRYYNDGETFWSDYGSDSCGSSALYLKHFKFGEHPFKSIIDDMLFVINEKYEKLLGKLITTTVTVLSDGKLFKKENLFDSDEEYYDEAIELWGCN